LSRYKRDEAAKAVVLDVKGNVELEDFYLRAKVVAAGNVEPGARIDVRIETVDAAKSEIRLRLA